MPKLNATPWAKLFVLFSLAVGAVIASRFVSREQAMELIDHARDIGLAGYVGFVVGYGIWCAFGLPGSVLNLGAAVAFGFWRALPLVLLGANFGAVLGFLLSRHFAREWFTQLVGKRMALAQINRAVAESGWRIVMLTRMPPISPFGIVNYAYGLTPVTLRDYMIGTAIGIIPGTTAYVYLGTILGDVAQTAHRTRSAAEWGILVGGFVLTVVACVYAVRLAKAALDRHAIEK